MTLSHLILYCTLLSVAVMGSVISNKDFQPTGLCRKTFPENQTFTRDELFDIVNRRLGTNHSSLLDFDILITSFIHLACSDSVDGNDNCTLSRPGIYGPLLTYICCKLNIDTQHCPTVDLEIQTLHLVGSHGDPANQKQHGNQTFDKIFDLLQVHNGVTQGLVQGNTFNRRLEDDQTIATHVNSTNDTVFDIPCPHAILKGNDTERCQYVQSTFRYAFFGDELPDGYCDNLETTLLGQGLLQESLQNASDQYVLNSSATVRMMEVGIWCNQTAPSPTSPPPTIAPQTTPAPTNEYGDQSGIGQPTPAPTNDYGDKSGIGQPTPPPTPAPETGLTPPEKFAIVMVSLSAVYVSVGCCQVDLCSLAGSSTFITFFIRIFNRFFWGYMLRYPMKVVKNNSPHEIKLFYRNLTNTGSSESEIAVSKEKSFLEGFAKMRVSLGRREREVGETKNKPHKKVIQSGNADDMFVRDNANAQITVARHVTNYNGALLNDEPVPTDGHLILLYREKVHISKKFVELGNANNTSFRTLERDIEREGGEIKFIPDDKNDSGLKAFMQELTSDPETKETV